MSDGERAQWNASLRPAERERLTKALVGAGMSSRDAVLFLVGILEDEERRDELAAQARSAATELENVKEKVAAARHELANVCAEMACARAGRADEQREVEKLHAIRKRVEAQAETGALALAASAGAEPRVGVVLAALALHRASEVADAVLYDQSGKPETLSALAQRLYDSATSAWPTIGELSFEDVLAIQLAALERCHHYEALSGAGLVRAYGITAPRACARPQPSK